MKQVTENQINKIKDIIEKLFNDYEIKKKIII